MDGGISWFEQNDFCARLAIFLPENAISTACPFGRASKTHVLKGFPMTAGTVKWFNLQKGFGFIAPDDGGKDAFVHISAVERAGLGDLREGQKLTYEVIADPKNGKLSADNLKVQG
jgi:CspA family cold shock protein